MDMGLDRLEALLDDSSSFLSRKTGGRPSPSGSPCRDTSAACMGGVMNAYLG